MPFTDYKITAFSQPVAALPDQPNLSPEALKARFDACPEQLRQSLNAVCDDAARLDERVGGIITETFGDTIPKSMLRTELQAELDAKAEKTALAAESTAREALAQVVADKCSVTLGFYAGDGTPPRTIELGFAAKALLVWPASGQVASNYYTYGAFVLEGKPATLNNVNFLELTQTGFTIRSASSGSYYARLNDSDRTYYYLAVR